MTETEPQSGYERRRMQTRRRILEASSALFFRDGYRETSMEEIATTAGVAIRTLYLHFGSKAAILLAYFDDWLDAFVSAVLARPVDEPLERTVGAALEQLRAAGWDDDRSAEQIGSTPPVVEFLTAGMPEIAGHIVQRWVAAQSRIAVDVQERGGYPPESLVPRARAAAVFGSWIATVLTFHDALVEGRPVAISSHEIGVTIAGVFGGGLDGGRSTGRGA